jgi:DNA-directed RNA polymerase specialized sigma24 family protein
MEIESRVIMTLASAVLTAEELELLELTLRRLPWRTQIILRLRAEGLSKASIGRRIGRCNARIGTLLQEAYQHIQHALVTGELPPVKRSKPSSPYYRAWKERYRKGTKEVRYE